MKYIGSSPTIGIFLHVSVRIKKILKGIVEHVSMMGVPGTQGGFALTLFQGWNGGVKYFGKCAALISAFEKSS